MLPEALRIVSKWSACRGLDLLREQSEMVGGPQMIREYLEGFVEPPRQREGLGEPETAQYEGSLGGFDPVVASIAPEIRPVRQLSNHPGDRSLYSGIGRGQKAIDGDQEQGCIGIVTTVLAHEGSALAIVPALDDLDRELITRPLPIRLGAITTEERREMESPIQRDPGHQFGVQVVGRCGALLPDPVVRLLGSGHRAADQPANLSPQGQAEGSAGVFVERCGIEQRPHDVVLGLVPRGVPQPDGTTPPMACEVTENDLFRHIFAVNGYHQIQRVALLDRVADELEEPERLLAIADQVHRSNRHGAVASPGIAIVPIAFATRDDG